MDRRAGGSFASRLFPNEIGGRWSPRPAGRSHSWGSPRPACGVGRLLQKTSAGLTPRESWRDEKSVLNKLRVHPDFVAPFSPLLRFSPLAKG